MVRGRLVAINGAPMDTSRLEEEQARRLAEREFNLSWSEALPQGNRIVDGKWWASGEAGGISLEEGIAKSLGVKLGDVLTYDIVGTRVEGKVTSLRKVDWDSFRVNFFALFAPGALDEMPRTYIAAVRADAGNQAWLSKLVREFPNVLVIDVGELLHQLQAIVEQVARAVEFVFLFTLLGGVLVLEAAIAATQDERRYDAAILRTLGALEAQLRCRADRRVSRARRARRAARCGGGHRDRVRSRGPGVPDTLRLESLGLGDRPVRRRVWRRDRRLAGHARDASPAAAGDPPPARLTVIGPQPDQYLHK